MLQMSPLQSRPGQLRHQFCSFYPQMFQPSAAPARIIHFQPLAGMSLGWNSGLGELKCQLRARASPRESRATSWHGVAQIQHQHQQEIKYIPTKILESRALNFEAVWAHSSFSHPQLGFGCSCPHRGLPRLKQAQGMPGSSHIQHCIHRWPLQSSFSTKPSLSTLKIPFSKENTNNSAWTCAGSGK